MVYELHLKAETIAELAQAVQQHHEELSSITNNGFGQTLANHIANREVSEKDWTLVEMDETTKEEAVKIAARFKPSNPVAPSHEASHDAPFNNAVDYPYHAATVQPDPSTSTADADGLPWDERIHSSNRKMTARGVWTRRKNVDDAVYNSVVAELRGAPQAPITGAFAADLPQPAPVPAQPVYAPVQETVVNHIPAFLQSVAQPAPVAAPVPAQPVHAAPAPTAPTINDLFVKLQQLSKEGVFTAQYNTDLIGALIQQFQVQVNSINDIAARPDMIAAAFQYIASRGN